MCHQFYAPFHIKSLFCLIVKADKHIKPIRASNILGHQFHVEEPCLPDIKRDVLLTNIIPRTTHFFHPSPFQNTWSHVDHAFGSQHQVMAIDMGHLNTSVPNSVDLGNTFIYDV